MTQGVLVPQHFLAPNSAETTRTASQKLDTALGRLALADADGYFGVDYRRTYEVTLTCDDGRVITEVVKAASGVIAEGDVRYKNGRPKARAKVRQVD